MTVTVIALPRELHKKLLAITKSTGLALAEQARRALAAWVEEHERRRGDR
jgi:predicted DNA-binding protein